MGELIITIGVLVLIVTLYVIIVKVRVINSCEKVIGVIKDLNPRFGNPYTIDATCKIKYKGNNYTGKARINLLVDSAKINKKVYFYVKSYNNYLKFIGAPSMFLLPVLMLVMAVSVIIYGILY